MDNFLVGKSGKVWEIVGVIAYISASLPRLYFGNNTRKAQLSSLLGEYHCRENTNVSSTRKGG